MSLTDRLHCPDCQGRLDAAFVHELRCSDCGHRVPIVEGIADFAAGRPVPDPGVDRYSGLIQPDGLPGPDLPAGIKIAAAGRWPQGFGDTIEFGCGAGPMTEAIVANEAVRSLLVLDSDVDMLRRCRTRIGSIDLGCDRFPSFAALDGGRNALRDAVADTVVGSVLLAGLRDVRGFLSMIHRVLKPGGRAMFVVPNRRYRQAICLALAEALTQHFTQHDAWPDECDAVMNLLAESRRLLVQHDNQAHVASLEATRLFDGDALEELCGQIGFAAADMIPLDPDPAGAEAITRICRGAGASDSFARTFAPLAAAIGRPFLTLLSEREAASFSVLWLTKATGPTVRVHTGRPTRPGIIYPGPDAALGGAPPRWSVELLGWDTPEGIMVKVGGWCLSNIDALDVRIVLDGNMQSTPVWRQRPDVHEVLNRRRTYHALNALCSGLDGELRFPGIHPVDGSTKLHVAIMLAGGLTVAGPAPDTLVMDQPMVIAY